MTHSEMAALLTARTELEFFIRISDYLPKHRVNDIKCSTELSTLGSAPRPAFELTLSLLLPHAYGESTGSVYEKVWIFTLDADSHLSWKIAHFDRVSPSALSLPTYTQLHGLQAIQEHLRKTEGNLPKELLSAPTA